MRIEERVCQYHEWFSARMLTNVYFRCGIVKSSAKQMTELNKKRVTNDKKVGIGW